MDNELCVCGVGWGGVGYFVCFGVVVSVVLMWPSVEWPLNECTVISCSYYFPEAFWNHHLTENKTVIQIAAPLANITLATPSCTH